MKEYFERTKLTEKKNAIRIFLKKAVGDNQFGSVDVYVKSSDKSGGCYVKYNLVYEKNAVETVWGKGEDAVPLTWYNGSNGGFNRSNYRIKAGEICKWNGENFEKLYDVLQQGEISMAFKEKFADGSAFAGDFVGGFHGDENIKFENGKPLVKMILDGAEIPLDGKEEREYVGDILEFEQTTLMNRCNTPSVDLMEHNQKFIFDTLGVHVEQNAEILTSDYEPGGKYALDNGGTYLQMCTFWRVDNMRNDGRICDNLNFYDENNKLVNQSNTSAYNKGDFSWTGVETESINRTVEYNGDVGIYGRVGFEIIDNSVDCHSAKIMVRTHGDNKWYCTFKSKNPNGQPKKGEKWKLKLLYYVDYNSER
jgi:hypothetical protein